MRNDKHLAIKLRKEGKSYSKISIELGISKSTLSDWFSQIDWSREIRDELTRKANYVAQKRLRLINKERKERLECWREGFRQEARKEFPKLIKNPLFITGINLYWGEGDHKLENGRVALINTDPRIIHLFSKFVREILEVSPEKFHAWLILYPDLSEKTCKEFWSKASQIPFEHFKKTQFIQGRHPTRKTAHGMCTVQTHSRGLKEKIFIWIDLLYSSYK